LKPAILVGAFLLLKDNCSARGSSGLCDIWAASGEALLKLLGGQVRYGVAAMAVSVACMARN